MKYKCLVLGACGFLGVNLCEKLLKNHYDVIAYNHLSKHVEDFQVKFPDIPMIIGDFTKQTQVEFASILQDVDIVFHLISTTDPANKDVLYDFESNVIPTVRFLNACRDQHVKKVIYFSSGGTVYGIARYIPIDEEHRTDPISAYGIHKLTIEKIFEYYGRTYNLPYIVMRIANPYGPGQDPKKKQGILTVALAKAFQGEEISIWGNGSVVRDYIFIEDVMCACIKAIDYIGNHRVFNIGSGQGYSIRDILYKIQRQTRIVLNISYNDARIQDVPVNVLDNRLAEKELNWRPCVCLDDGIFMMIQNMNKIAM